MFTHRHGFGTVEPHSAMFSLEEVQPSLSNPGTSPPEQMLETAVSPTVELTLTAVYTVLYSLLFLFVYLQLWLVLHYGHKRVSYQTGFLFLCLLWAALRTTGFSFYFQNASQASGLKPLVYWLLYCLPVCLQFFTLCLLNLYFTQVMFKAKAKYSPELTKYKVPLRLLFLGLSLLFLVVNLTCSLLVREALERSEQPSEGGVRRAVLARVLINDSLFVVCAVSLAVCIFKIAKMSSANVYLESKGTSVYQATAVGFLVTVLYTSRACYNLAVVTLSPSNKPRPFNYSWYSISDQADVQQIRGETYVVFGIVLFLWEFLPTFLLVVFFRVQKPNQNLATGGMVNSHSFSSRAYFFDNPRRYDSDDDSSQSINTHRAERTSLLSSTQAGPHTSWYSAAQRNGSLTGVTLPPAHLPASSSTPLLFTYGATQSHHHLHHHLHHHNYYSTPQNNNYQHHNHYSTPQNYYCGPQTLLSTPHS